jgi:DNA polymerase III subunit epsilon
MFLAFDTETQGLPLFREPSDHPDQPHIVQFAALLIDPETRAESRCVDLIVRPDGWTISPEVSAIHGITHERAMDEGVPEAQVREAYLDMLGVSHLRIAHNTPFDDRIMRICMLRGGIARDAIEILEARDKFCTMRAASDIMKLPPTERMARAGFSKPKPPRLEECIEFFFGEKMEGAHNALFDTRACARVYWHLMDMKAAAE